MSSAQLLPNNRTTLEGAVLDATVLRELNPDVIRTLYDADLCPAAFLPHLGWSLSVDFWELATTDDQRRDLIRNAIQWHRKRGTPWAIKSALRAFGYPVLDLIEQAEYHRQWRAAGGHVLDGTWQLDGSVPLTVPVGATDSRLVQRVALNHWAEYAIRLDAAGEIWTRAQQRKIRRVAESFAPERSHLIGLIAGLSLAFSEPLTMAGPRTTVRVNFDCCNRFKPVQRLMLDGCWTLGGGVAPQLLNGWLLDGRRLTGERPVGQRLDDGHLAFRNTLRVQLYLHMGGAHADPPVPLGNLLRTLDGAWSLGETRLGGWRLSEGITLGDNQFNRLGLRRLDATWRLGGAMGGPGLHFNAIARVRRAGITRQEPMMDTLNTTPVTHAYRAAVATCALTGAAMSRIAFMAFSESSTPYSAEQDTTAPGEFVRVPITGEVSGPSLKVTGLLTGAQTGERVVRSVAVFTQSGLLVGRRVLRPKELEADASLEIEMTFTY